jgi:YHS domain-containing protein
MQERCPVCGKRIDPNDAVERTEYQGKTYPFCCSACKDEFQRHPEHYAAEGTKKR